MTILTSDDPSVRTDEPAIVEAVHDEPAVPTSALARLRRRAVEWLPAGGLLPSSIWVTRHRWITWFALAQALALGLYGLARGVSAPDCAFDVLIVGLPALLGMSTRLHRRMRTNCATVSLMFASAMLVELTGGLTEAHFHFFVMLGVVALYQDWVAYGVCLLIIVLHHAIMGIFAARSVFGSAEEWQHPLQFSLIHAAFVLAACITHLIAWKANEQQGLSDPLTRLANRTAFVEALDRRLASSAPAVSVLFIDLDDFKTINDSRGHHVGDIALQQVAERMLKVVREGDVVARLGGDEFAVLISGDAARAATMARRISAHLQHPVDVDGREFFIQASIGVADNLLAGSRDAHDLLRDADLAMYLAKSSGKNQVVIYTAGIDKIVSDRAALAVDMRSALTSGELAVHYQPLMRGERLFGVEALLRWYHPQRGLVSPVEFIPIAEETGEIAAIGAWVLATAADQVAVWRATIVGCEDLEVAVNLSPVQLRNPDLIHVVSGALRTSGLPAHCLTLEVTEGVLLSDLDLARRQLDAVRELGVLVAIDDFGTGYSSLSYLAKLPADQIKIDQSFVANLSHSNGSVLLVKAIIDMARALDLDILAEGVELDAQQNILSDLGCPASQGYLYSKPLSPDDFEKFVGGDKVASMDDAAVPIGVRGPR